MTAFLIPILALAIISGQLIKVPLFNLNGIIFLDAVVITLSIIGAMKLKLKFQRPPGFIIGALFFILIAVVSLILTPLKLQPQDYLFSILYTVRFASYIFLGWVLYSGAYPRLRKNIPQILLFSGLIVAVLGLIQFIFLPDLKFLEKSGWDPHLYRTASTFLDPNFVGAFFVLTLLVLYSQLTNFFSKKSKLFYLFFALVYLALLTTFSRSSYGMFLISFLTLAFFKKSIKLALTALLLFAVLIFSFQNYVRAVNTITPIDRVQTAKLRLTTWQQGANIFGKNPILGVGFNAYPFALKQYGLGDELFLQSKGSTTNDSSLLYVLATTGILGFLSYALFILGMIKTAKPILVSAIFGLLAHSFFVNNLFYPFILVWLMLEATS